MEAKRAIEPLTDREWWLVRETHLTTLKVLLETCLQTGAPGTVVATALLREPGGKNLRLATDLLLAMYRAPDAN